MSHADRGTKDMKHIKYVFYQGLGPTPLKKVKIQLFQNMVMMHIKLKGIWYAAPWKQTFCPQSLP